MIPDEAVEAAAREVALTKLHGRWWSAHEWDSGVMDDRYKQPFIDAARAALEAAAPHIRAKALTDAAESWQVRMDTTGRGSADAKLFMQQRAAIERVAK